MTENVRPPEINKELYNEFKKYCIDNDLEKGKTLEKAVREFIEEEDE